MDTEKSETDSTPAAGVRLTDFFRSRLGTALILALTLLCPIGCASKPQASPVIVTLSEITTPLPSPIESCKLEALVTLNGKGLSNQEVHFRIVGTATELGKALTNTSGEAVILVPRPNTNTGYEAWLPKNNFKPASNIVGCGTFGNTE